VGHVTEYDRLRTSDFARVVPAVLLYHICIHSSNVIVMETAAAASIAGITVVETVMTYRHVCSSYDYGWISFLNSP